MKILIAGASGYIGRQIVKKLLKDGHSIVALSRTPKRQKTHEMLIWKQWRNNDATDWKEELKSTDAIVNLIGEGIVDKRWSSKRKDQLLSSRIDPINLFISVLKESKNRPAQFIQASAIGVYKAGQNGILDESIQTGGSFLADLTVKWENASKDISDLGIIRFIARIGLVVSSESVIIKKFKLPFSLFVGGHLGNGKQWMPWIHLDDVGSAISFLIEKNPAAGEYNLTSPNPVRMKEFCKALGKSMNKPSWMHVPAFVLKIIFGQMAKETMLAELGQYHPKRLQESGFKFASLNAQKTMALLEDRNIRKVPQNYTDRKSVV